MNLLNRLRLSVKNESNYAYLALFCAVAMAYGWGWRGNYGHETGAMLPGALLAMAGCLASRRLDWFKRCVVAGLCGAIGWFWGGSFSYMEQVFYVVSDSLPDVAYAYACIGFLGMLWAGIGGAILAMAFTKGRCELEKFARVLIAIGAVWLLLFYVYASFSPEQRHLFEQLTVDHFHDTDWLSPLMILVIAGIYWLLRPKDRSAAGLYIACAAAWWVGYLALTKFGGLELAPPYRSEGWGGILGVLVVLLVYHIRQKNRAAVMLTLYGMLTGFAGFILAVFVHVPFRIEWGPFTSVSCWKIAEESFGLFMGFGVSLGIIRLLKGGLTAAEEDVDRGRLDLFAVFVLVIVMMWMNLRKNVRDWGSRYDILPVGPQFGLQAWHWFLIVGILWTLFILYCLKKYRQGKLILVPQTAYEKGALVFCIIVLISLIGVAAHRITDWKPENNVVSYASYWILALFTIWLLIGISNRAKQPLTGLESGVPAHDKKWKVGWRYWVLWVCAFLLIAVVTSLTLAMQDKSHPGSRKRFGPDAYWRQKLPAKR